MPHRTHVERPKPCCIFYIGTISCFGSVLLFQFTQALGILQAFTSLQSSEYIPSCRKQHCEATSVTCRMPFCKRESQTTSAFQIDMLKSKLHLRLTKVSQHPSFIITLQIGQRSLLNKPEKNQTSPICCKVGQKTILEEHPKIASLKSYIPGPVHTQTQSNTCPIHNCLFTCKVNLRKSEFLLHVFSSKNSLPIYPFEH